RLRPPGRQLARAATGGAAARTAGMPGIGRGELAVVIVLTVSGAVVETREARPVLAPQRQQQRRTRAGDETGEGLQLAIGPGGLGLDEGPDAVEAAQRVVEAHDLERAPAGRLHRRGGIRRGGAVQ